MGNDAPAKVSGRYIRKRLIALVCIWVVLCLLLPMLNTFRQQITTNLLFGWFYYLTNEMPRVRINRSAVVLAACLIALLILGGHGVLGWLYREWGADRLGGKDTLDNVSPRKWRFRWTLSSLGIVVLLFIVGIAATAVIHHLLWLYHDVQAQDFLVANQRRRSWR